MTVKSIVRILGKHKTLDQITQEKSGKVKIITDPKKIKKIEEELKLKNSKFNNTTEQPPWIDKKSSF